MTRLSSRLSEDTLQAAREMLSQGNSTEEILAFLKKRGANAIASIHALQALFNLSAAEAQQRLYDSEAWRDMR